MRCSVPNYHDGLGLCINRLMLEIARFTIHCLNCARLKDQTGGMAQDVSQNRIILGQKADQFAVLGCLPGLLSPKVLLPKASKPPVVEVLFRPAGQ